MIGKLKGLIEDIEDNSVLLDVNGVCYIVFISTNSRAQLPPIGQAASLLIETHVREDHIHLYGFFTQEEKQWFNLLTTVKGVGNKMALSFLSSMQPQQISLAIATSDDKSLIAISGVGKKLAQRLITELADKVGKLSSTSSIALNLEVANTGNEQTITDAVSALTNLGYGRSQSYIVVTNIISQQADISVENLIRQSLVQLSE